MSVLEISHRSSAYETIYEAARSGVLSLMGLDPTQFDVLFLGGGASLQFLMAPMNFLTPDGHADYIDTGSWSLKAIAEARRVGPVQVVASSSADAYRRLPEVGGLDRSASYVHLTTNNTIEGTQWVAAPEDAEAPLVADMSSDFLSRRRDFDRYSLIYAGAQKNAGPAGVTVVVTRRSFLDAARADLPPMLSYRIHRRENSAYNTPPVFAVYVVSLMCEWIRHQGGLAAMERRNEAKAAIVYGALDAHDDAYEPVVTEKAHRSSMNITFRIRDASREADFLSGASARGMVGLKGHRSVGGLRASLYNAAPMAWAEALADYLAEFARL
jgi:phosphoserine aminotransferase